ncbi:MAG: acyltransferase family protein [Fimbriimonadaceae bacterium]
MTTPTVDAFVRPTTRYAALDGLRGVAALCVVQYHVFQTGCYGKVPDLVQALFQGYFAVLVFFVLSGFALSAALERPHAYPKWLARRALRLYPPVIAAVALYLVAERVPAVGRIPYSLTGFILPAPHSASQPILAAALILGHPGGVLWSMAVEVRASILMPLIKLLANWLTARAFRLWVAVAAVGLAEATAAVLGWEGLLTRWAQASYLLLFVTGALIYANREFIKDRYASSPWLANSLLVTAGVLTLAAHGAGAGEYSGWNLAILKLAAILSVASLLAGGATGGRLLTSRPVAFLGAVSYSLYLCHSLVIEALRATLPHLYSAAPVFNAACLALSLLLAWGLHAAVEQPAISWSRRFAN